MQTLSEKFTDMLDRTRLVGQPMDANFLIFVANIAKRVDELTERVRKYDEVEGRVEGVESYLDKRPWEAGS